MTQVSAYATHSATDELKPFTISRREVTENDVKIDIDYCGVCHSDIHTARNDWHGSQYPVVPGHEIVGRVSDVGSNVSMFKVGDVVGVGCMVDSCRTCLNCKEKLEQYCDNTIFTYNSKHPKHGGITYGGYSKQIVVDQDFVLRIPEHLDRKSVAPLLCAGITTYSPLRHWKIKKGDRIGVIGLGGLGHMGIKMASAMGAHVTMITRSPSKGEDARKLGADEVLLSSDEAQMNQHANHFDFLLNTIPVTHDVNPYLYLLKRDATMVMVGVLGSIESSLDCIPLVTKRKVLAGSMIGGMAETQEMLDFCGEHNITSDVEMINMADINNAYERILKSDVKYRFVIDMKTLK